MSDKQFISDLSATYADVRRLDVKKINLKGKNILEYIKENVPVIKHAQDTRETVTENDLWGQWVETTTDGTIIIHDDEVTNPNASSYSAWNNSITTVEDNKAYVDDEFYANIQTEMIKDGNQMFFNCSNLTSFSSDLSSLTNGYQMFRGTALTSFNSDLSSLTNGYRMFRSTALTSFTSDLNSLTDGSSMFNGCSNLTSFSSDLSNLTNGDSMFNSCSNLTSFTSDLNSLTYVSSMFNGCSNLTSFTSDLNSLIDGDSMFNGCSNLTSFSSDLSNLTNGSYMFYDCVNLTSFTSDLSSLTTGSYMFKYCKLDPTSVLYVADSIKDIVAEKALYTNGAIPWVTHDRETDIYSSPQGFMENGNYVYTYNNPKPYTTYIRSSVVGQLTLGIDVTNDANTIQEQLQSFAKEAYFDSWAELKQAFVDKGWTVAFQYGGTDANITYDLRNGEQIIPCPIFAKLIEAANDSAKYCTEDASSFYNIEWGHDVTDITDYTQFDSFEDAMASWNVFPKENIITTEE